MGQDNRKKREATLIDIKIQSETNQDNIILA